jgi:hypothetical protein
MTVLFKGVMRIFKVKFDAFRRQIRSTVGCAVDSLSGGGQCRSKHAPPASFIHHTQPHRRTLVPGAAPASAGKTARCAPTISTAPCTRPSRPASMQPRRVVSLASPTAIDPWFADEREGQYRTPHRDPPL